MASIGKLMLAVVRARGNLLVGVAGSCLAGAVGYGLLAADHYRAVATLFIDPSPFDARALNGGPTSARGSELDLLRSERVAQRVVENERLVEEPALRPLYLENIDAGRPPIEALAQYVADRVDVTGSDDGGLVRLSVTLGNAALAARVANAYAQAWGEVSLELRANAIRSGVERAHQDLVSLRARLGEARTRLSGGNALAAAGSRADAQFAQLSQLSTHSLAPSSAAVSEAVPAGVSGANRGATIALAAEPAGMRLENIGDAGLANGQDAGHWDGLRRETRDAPITHVERADAGATAAMSADDDIRLAQQSLERAEDRLARLAAEGIGAPFPAHMLRAAPEPSASTKPGLGVCAALGLAAGIVLGIFAMLLAEVLDRRVRRPADFSRATGIVVLGILPAALPAAALSRRSRLPRLRGGNAA